MGNPNIVPDEFRLDWHEPAENSIRVPFSVIVQMLAGIKFDLITDCWNFTAPSPSKDHPALNFGDRHTISLDILMLMFETDAPTPAGAHVLRSCGNPRCLAPYHLRWSCDAASPHDGLLQEWPERAITARAGAAVRYCEGIPS